jgi:hypothetical protein
MKSMKNLFKQINVTQRFLYGLLSLVLFLAVSCEEKDDPIVPTFQVKVQLAYPEGFTAKEGVKVILENKVTNLVLEVQTGSTGLAEFDVIAGAYEASASDSSYISGNQYLFNGVKSNIVITDAWSSSEIITLDLVESKVGQLVIKEYYFNGCQNNAGSGTFQRDPYVILYNNSDQSASLENVSFGATLPANSQASNNDYINGELFYAAEGWVPAGFGIFYFNTPVTLAPGEQVVIAINSANDHTGTYTNSVNLANANYYVFYDPESGFANTTYHPAPSALIPASHYLKAIRFPGVTSTAYTMSAMSPAFFIFATERITPDAFSDDPANRNIYGTGTSQVRLKVPVDWVIDAVEVFQKGAAVNNKRFPATVDAGSINFPDVKQGYTLYRNVNKAATEALASNAGKLVYNYSLAVDGTSDPSGIDAEASIKNGAHIIYKNTNNAGADFHVRGVASLK